MSNRKKIVFKVNNEVVLEESADLFINQIDELKWKIAEETETPIDLIEVEYVEAEKEYSDDIDATYIGLVFWRSLFHEPIKGVKCLLRVGSDEYLDRINDGTIINYMVFIV